MTTAEERRIELLTDGLMTIEEVEEFTRLSRSDLYARMERGELPFTKLGRRRMVPRRAVLAMAEKGLVAAG